MEVECQRREEQMNVQKRLRPRSQTSSRSLHQILRRSNYGGLLKHGGGIIWEATHEWDNTITMNTKEVGPPLWSKGQSSRLKSQRSGFDSPHYQIF
jgi:hypothetical protein